jgi:putative membrane protein
MSDPRNTLLFLSYFGTAIVLFGAFLAAYTLATRIKEWELIRASNTAAALSSGGAMIGFALPLAAAIGHSGGLADMVVTAAVALVGQLLCFAAMRLLRRDASAALVRGDMAKGILLASVSVVLGMLNAACLG